MQRKAFLVVCKKIEGLCGPGRFLAIEETNFSLVFGDARPSATGSVPAGKDTSPGLRYNFEIGRTRLRFYRLGHLTEYGSG